MLPRALLDVKLRADRQTSFAGITGNTGAIETTVKTVSKDRVAIGVLAKTPFGTDIRAAVVAVV